MCACLYLCVWHEKSATSNPALALYEHTFKEPEVHSHYYLCQLHSDSMSYFDFSGIRAQPNLLLRENQKTLGSVSPMNQISGVGRNQS